MSGRTNIPSHAIRRLGHLGITTAIVGSSTRSTGSGQSISRTITSGCTIRRSYGWRRTKGSSFTGSSDPIATPGCWSRGRNTGRAIVASGTIPTHSSLSLSRTILTSWTRKTGRCIDSERQRSIGSRWTGILMGTDSAIGTIVPRRTSIARIIDCCS